MIILSATVTHQKWYNTPKMPDQSYSRTVYTTESGRVRPQSDQPASRPKGDGVVRVSLDRKGRAGKSVTLVTGLPGSEDDLKALAAELKRRCGTGGTLKDRVIEIQGDHRDTLVTALQSKGFIVKRSGG
jgi:translation initiation factor 1